MSSGYKQMYLLLLLFQFIPYIQSQTIHIGSTIDCYGTNICRDDIILCNAFTNCTITCRGQGSCRNTTISCPINAKCIINCDIGYDDTCRLVKINATTSTSLTLNCPGYYDDACDEGIVYCPINGHSGPIQCNIMHVSTYAIHRGFHIYAVEGFNDVQITGAGGIQNAVVHCRENYGTSCNIPQTAPYECSACQNILSPTQYPTDSPSYNPTTLPTFIPTINPTNIPTIDPTNDPTYHPTSNTAAPTNYPTMVPTATPTIVPTNYPTSFPTKSSTPAPVLVIRFREPTVSPIMYEGVNMEDTTTTTMWEDGKDNDLINKKGMDIFSNTSNVVILILSVVIGILLCIIGVYLMKKHIKKRRRKASEDIIIIQMHNKYENNVPIITDIPSDSIDFKKQPSSIAIAATPVANVSDALLLMDVNTEEGLDGYIDDDDDDVFVGPTPIRPKKEVERERKSQSEHMLRSNNRMDDRMNSDAHSYKQQQESEEENEEAINVYKTGHIKEDSFSESSVDGDERDLTTTIGNIGQNENESNDSDSSEDMKPMKMTDIGESVAAVDP